MVLVGRRDVEERDRSSPNCCTRSGSSDNASCIKNKVNKQDVSPMCRLRGKREETSIKTGVTTRLLKFSTGIFVCKKFLNLQRSKT